MAGKAVIMNFLHGITILLAYQLVGEVSVRLLGLPIPGPVMGMVMLFLTLVVRGRAGAALDHAAPALLSHLSLLFVPAGVGIMVHFGRIADEWVSIGIAMVLSTVITLAATAGIMLLMTRVMARRNVRHD